jgi:lysozyme
MWTRREVAMIPGIDVSNWQGEINWSAVQAAGHQFAFIKATEGLSYQDPFFYPNWGGARVAGLVPGAYHFARPEHGSGREQALYFLTYEDPTPGDLLALDLESGPRGAGLAGFALDFLTTCYQETGCRPLLYSSRAFLAEHGIDASTPEIGEYGLWLASWASRPGPIPAPWSFWAIWQSGGGPVPGISDNCDLDRFNGTHEQLTQYGIPG